VVRVYLVKVSLILIIIIIILITNYADINVAMLAPLTVDDVETVEPYC
jgi:hypothetical protein